MGRKPIKRSKPRTPLRENIYKRLEELIIFGALEPGHHLVETDIANQLGVSRIPVREALQVLHREGWVDLRPELGAFVHQPTVEEVENTFSITTLLEVESARLAATNVTDESDKSLKAVVLSGKTALIRGDENELVELNSLFHSTVSRMGGNFVLESLIAALDKRIRWYFAPVAKLRGPESWREHQVITDAIVTRDPERASDAMREHIELTRDAHRAFRTRESAAGQPAQASAPGNSQLL